MAVVKRGKGLIYHFGVTQMIHGDVLAIAQRIGAVTTSGDPSPELLQAIVADGVEAFSQKLSQKEQASVGHEVSQIRTELEQLKAETGEIRQSLDSTKELLGRIIS